MMFSTIEDAWSSKSFQVPHSCASSNLSSLVDCPHCREKLSSLLFPERKTYQLFEGFGMVSEQVNNLLLVMVVIVVFKILHIL